MILGASRSLFSLLSPKEEVLANSLLRKNLLPRACPALPREGSELGSG
jgi:hypothetical protein